MLLEKSGSSNRVILMQNDEIYEYNGLIEWEGEGLMKCWCEDATVCWSLPLWIKSTNGGKRDLRKIIWRLVYKE
jgi:hypothetical protein